MARYRGFRHGPRAPCRQARKRTRPAGGERHTLTDRLKQTPLSPSRLPSGPPIAELNRSRPGATHRRHTCSDPGWTGGCRAPLHLQIQLLLQGYHVPAVRSLSAPPCAALAARFHLCGPGGDMAFAVAPGFTRGGVGGLSLLERRGDAPLRPAPLPVMTAPPAVSTVRNGG